MINLQGNTFHRYSHSEKLNRPMTAEIMTAACALFGMWRKSGVSHSRVAPTIKPAQMVEMSLGIQTGGVTAIGATPLYTASRSNTCTAWSSHTCITLLRCEHYLRTREQPGQLAVATDHVHDGGAREGACGGVGREAAAKQVGKAQAPQLLRCAAQAEAFDPHGTVSRVQILCFSHGSTCFSRYVERMFKE